MILILKLILVLGLLFGIYIVSTILWATFTNFDPLEKENVVVNGNPKNPIKENKTYTIYNWNIGYAGLGSESNFFYDGGEMVRPKQNMVDKYFSGILNTVDKWKDADFIFLQEVDIQSKRSYFLAESQLLAEKLNTFYNSIAINYKVNYIPIPIMEPMGKVQSGIITFGKTKPKENIRFQFPSKFPWPKNLFMLDRCMLLQRHTLPNNKELIVINHHLSAYDNTGILKAAEMDYLKKIITDEYKKGNYVVVGGDWNQCPPDFNPYTTMSKEEADYDQSNITTDFMPSDWIWAYDKSVNTNRKLVTSYQAGKTFTTIIDFYLLSPNIQVNEIKGIDLGFANSDHQPVKLVFSLK